MRNAFPGLILLVAGLLPTACGGETTDQTGATTPGGSGQGGGGTAGSGQGGSGQAGAGQGGSGQAGSGNAGSGNAAGVAGSPGACDTFVGQASQVEISLSPFADADAELLAIEASGKIVAPAAMVERISSDLKAIRAHQPEVQQIHAAAFWATDRIELSFDAGAKAALGDGSYAAWDCQNAWYGVEKKSFGPISDKTQVSLTFSHRYDPALLVKDYASLPFILYAEPSHMKGDGSTICASFDQTIYSYIFDAGSGDCPAGCIDHTYWGFSSDGAAIMPLGTFSTPTPPPAWFKALGDCTKWL